jgi:hexosaminidase
VESSSKGGFPLKHLSSIVVDSDYRNAVDTEGETLIPPTLLSFAMTFGTDLESSLGLNVPVITGKLSAENSIFMTISKNPSQFLDAAGRSTSEGYSIDVTSHGIVITGASPLGAWWATRTVLQQGVLNEGMELSLGSATDAPGWGIRGAFVSCLSRSYENYTHVSPSSTPDDISIHQSF